MRIVLIYLLLLLSLVSVSAQLDYSSHAYVTGDSLIKQQVVYCNPGSKGRDLNWNFSFLQADEEPYVVAYRTADSTKAKQLCAIEHQTRYYYHQTSDSVWCLGYENPTTCMRYSQPELLLTYPFKYGDTISSHFAGKGQYGHRLPFSIEGNTFVEADAEGELRLPDGIVRNALRIHTQRSCLHINGDNIHSTEHIYRWYAAGMRYPVLESVTYQEDDTIMLQTSFYYYPVHLTDSYEDNNANRNFEPIDTVFADAVFHPNPVVSNLLINYTLTRSATVCFCLYTTSGMPLYLGNTEMQNEGQHSYSIGMSACPTGSYTLYIYVDNMQRRKVIIKQ